MAGALAAATTASVIGVKAEEPKAARPQPDTMAPLRDNDGHCEVVVRVSDPPPKLLHELNKFCATSLMPFHVLFWVDPDIPVTIRVTEMECPQPLIGRRIYGPPVKLPPIDNRIIVTNPPYGIRIKPTEDFEIFYKSLGDFLKQKCTGSTAFIFFGERKYIKSIGLKASWKKPIAAGGLDGRLVKYEMY